jgi:hypothetical protein
MGAAKFIPPPHSFLDPRGSEAQHRFQQREPFKVSWQIDLLPKGGE